MTITKDIDTLKKRIGELEAQASSLRNQREVLNDELKKWKDKRNSLNSTLRKKWKEINLLKDKRDEVNQAVKKLKKDEADVITQIELKNREHVDVIQNANKRIDKISHDYVAISHQIKDLDWKIQTNPLSPTEEVEIIKQISHLEKELLIRTEALNLKNKMNTLLSQIQDLTVHRNTLRVEKTESVKKSREYHNKMLERIKEADRFKIEADLAHKKVLEFIEKAREIHEKFLKVISQINNIDSKIREIEESIHRKDVDNMIEKQNKEAYEKFKRKKKLTLNEYKLLRKRGLA